MLHDAKDDFLLVLANTLTGNQTNTTSIEKALKLLCHASSFDCGLVYETDFSGGFSLLGRYSKYPVPFPESLCAGELSLPISLLSLRNGASLLLKKPQNANFERQLLDQYSAQALALAPIMEEDSSLYGLVVLLNPNSNAPMEAAEQKLLSIGLSMLVHYIERRMYQKRLLQAQITMESILDNTGIDIYVNDFHTHEILYVNKSMAAPYGGKAAFMGQTCWQTLFPGQTGPCEFCPQKKLVDSHGLPTKVYTWDYQRSFDGSWFRVFNSAFRWVDGRLAHVVSSADITDNKRNEALVENLAHYDQLTKLPNRRMLVKECEQRIDCATALEQGYVLFFDIDGFKLINDNFGHDAGDEFLIQLGEFFTSIPLLHDSIYRNGGDEFVAIIGGESISKADIRQLTNFIHERFKRPWVLKKGSIYCSTSIGVACYPEDGTTAETLLQKADMAMYQVKKSGGGGLCFGHQLRNTSPANST